ncbi:peroxide stress protein YaaA [Candidatus Woesearchaeota archaeon]|nr:peroxide stress protein YaaA [Candidatus Woesearchaeota archaeon]
MIITLSPAKTLNYQTKVPFDNFSIPEFLKDSKELIDILKKKNEKDISNLMNVSSSIAKLNYERYQKWQIHFTKNNARQAIFTFNGAVYKGLNFSEYNKQDFERMQKNIRILSGLYGILKPLDLMQPYRLEMGTKLENKKGKNLYEFWKETITKKINEECDDILINLASKEYSDTIDTKKLKCEVIDIVFKDYKNGKYRIIGVNAKRARGLFANFIIKNNIKDVKDLTKFKEMNYKYDKNSSTNSELIFLRT